MLDQLIQSLREKDEQRARTIALDKSFSSSNPLCTENGTVVKIALEENLTQLATDLISAGFKLPLCLVLETIQNKNLDMLRKIVHHTLYDKATSELLVWCMLKENLLEEANIIIKSSEKLSSLLSRSSKSFLTDSSLCKLAMTQALNSCSNQISYKQECLSMENQSKTATLEHFHSAFVRQMLDLCVDLLKFKAARVVLHEPKVQEQLISLLSKGATCLSAMEMLSQINDRSWKAELTKELCSTLSNFAKKRDEIVLCPSPLLFCVLAHEFLNRIAAVSLQHSNRCTSTSSIFTDLGMKIQDNIKEENELRFFMNQKDSKGRSVISILSKNRVYSLLENQEVGTIVAKMWEGTRQHYGILAASAITTYGQSACRDGKPYVFQYSQWVDSCSLRFRGKAFSIVVLVAVYQLLMNTAVNAGSFQNLSDGADTGFCLLIAQAWIGGMMVELLLTALFSRKTGRGFEIGNWEVLDLAMFVLIILVSTDSLEGETLNAGAHSLILGAIWMKFMGILVTSKNFGPFLRMIYLIIGEVFNFFLVSLCFGICAASVFTAMFHKHSSLFVDFSSSVRSLFSATLASFNLASFTDNEAFGGILFGLFIILANVMLLNLLIALLSNVYSDLIIRVDSEHRAVVIGTYDKTKWDKRYGLLIFLPVPLNILSFLFTPFVLLPRNPEKVNSFICRLLYVFYAIPQFAMFTAVSLAYLPLAYARGFSKGKSNKTSKMVLWTFVGLPYLLFAFFKDLVWFWTILYKTDKISEDHDDNSKVHQMVDSEFLAEIQELMSEIHEEEISVKELTDRWAEKTKKDHLKEVAYDYFSQFSNSGSDLTIKMKRIRLLLPYRHYGSFSDIHIKRAKHICVPWMVKAIKKYQHKVGSVNFDDLRPENSADIDIQTVEKLESSVRDLREKYDQLLAVGMSVHSELEEQAALFEEAQ